MAERAATGVCCHDVFSFGGGGDDLLKNRRELRRIRRYRRWRELMYGWVVPTMPTRELYVQGNQGCSPGIESPLWMTEDYRSLRWAVYVSYHLSTSNTWWGVFRWWR